MNRNLRKRTIVDYNEENNYSDSDSDCDIHIIKKRIIEIEEENIEKISSIIEAKDFIVSDSENNESDSDSDYEKAKDFIVSDSENNEYDSEPDDSDSESDDSDSESSDSDSESDDSDSESDFRNYHTARIKTEIKELIDNIKYKIKNKKLKKNINYDNFLEINKRWQKKYKIKCDLCNKIRNCNHILTVSNKNFNIGTFCIKRIEIIKNLLELLNEDNYDYLKRNFKMYKKNYKNFELDLKNMDWTIFN
jgi:hypothetical protein